MGHPVVYAIALGVGIGTAIGVFLYNMVTERERNQKYRNQNNSYPNWKSTPKAKSEQCDEKCTICFDDITKGKAKITILECSHRFHEVCINSWMGAAGTFCPNCRELIR